MWHLSVSLSSCRQGFGGLCMVWAIFGPPLAYLSLVRFVGNSLLIDFLSSTLMVLYWATLVLPVLVLLSMMSLDTLWWLKLYFFVTGQVFILSCKAMIFRLKLHLNMHLYRVIVETNSKALYDMLACRAQPLWKYFFTL